MFRFSLLVVIFLIMQGCQTQSMKEIDINIALGSRVSTLGVAPDVTKLENFKNNSFLTSTKATDPIYAAEYSSAMESAVHGRNMEGVKYLVNNNAPNLVSMRWYDLKANKWMRTPVNVSAAEMACALGEIEIMDYLLQQRPQSQVNYTNCLHYYVSHGAFLNMETNQRYSVSGHAGMVIDEIVSRGGEVSGKSAYGNEFEYHFLDHSVSSGLPAALLKHGMDVNKPFKCGLKSDSCTQLTRLARKETQDINDMFYLLASNGANLNAKATMMMNVDVLNTGEIKTQEREVTPLHVAAYFNESEFYSRLIALGADETITDNQGNTPEQYANQFFRLKKSSRQQKEIYQQDVRERQAAERQSRDAVFGKALALGLGAAAISSVDVDSDIKAEVFSAFAEDVVTDSNGKNLNAINNRARSELQQQQQAFAKEVAAQIEKNTTVVAEVDGQQEKRVDCVYEYLKATQRVKSSGFKAECIEAHEDMKFCANKKRRMYHDEANRLLVEANLSQCQLDYLTPPTVPNKIRTKGGGSYEV